MVLIQYILVFVQYISSTARRSNFANCSCSSLEYGRYICFKSICQEWKWYLYTLQYILSTARRSNFANCSELIFISEMAKVNCNLTQKMCFSSDLKERIPQCRGQLRFDLLVGFTFVLSQATSRRKSLVTEVTRNTYSLQMISLYVISYQSGMPLLATHFANP